jgi:ankyrin repeat protein
MTPLYRAVLAGDLPAVRQQLAQGADVNDRNDDNRWTVLMAAIAERVPEIAAELLASPAIEVNARAERDLTALHVAAERGDARAVELLLGHDGIDVNAKDNLGRTALIIAAFDGDRAVVERLLARPDLEVNAVDRDRQTALAWAALGGDAGVVRTLLADARTNAGITNRPDGRTALDIATAAGNDAAAHLLRDAKPGEDRLAPGDHYEPRIERRPVPPPLLRPSRPGAGGPPREHGAPCHRAGRRSRRTA